MSFNTTFWANVFTTAYLLFVTGCVAQKVYFDCGAKVDVVDVQGLILSPGFPYNYSSGTHCVWQFFVPVGHQLILEIFDFDVFESHDASAQYGSVSEFDDEAYEGGPFTPAGSNDSGGASEKESAPQRDVSSKVPQYALKDEAKHVVVQEQSTKMEIARVSNSAKRSADAPSDPASPPPPSHPLLPGARPSGDNAANSASPAVRGDPNAGLAAEESTPTPATPTTASPTETESPETQQSVLDACPHDVLYISDLVAFSSRFCGSNRPSSAQLVFGSSQEMVEVIMELITTTHWGRGFALLFHYHNRTAQEEAAGSGDRHAYSPAGPGAESMLAAVSGAAFCAMVLTSALCVIFRPKLCPKRANSCSSNNSEVQEGVQGPVADASELRLVVPNRAGLDVPAENASYHPSPGLGQTHAGSPVCAGGDASLTAELELSSNGLTELDLGTDEVFIISSAPSPGRPAFSLHTRERFLRHSDTGPVKDWPSPDPTASGSKAAAQDGTASCARPRAWSVRTFQDFLPPLPQLHKKWCSWNSTSPFTKLVDSAPASLLSACRSEGNRKVFSDVHLDAHDDSAASDSCTSAASYPLAQPGQRQRRLNSASNLRRSRFTGPCFGLLSAPAEPAKTPGGALHLQAPSSEASSGSLSPQPQADGDHVSVPVFAISEEEDRQPLVLAEHLGQASSGSALNGLSRGGAYDGKGSAAGSPLLFPRGRSEWRPWGSQASGGASPLPLDSPTSNTESKSTFRHSTAGQTQLPLLSQSTVPCSVAGKEM
ncbi:uncharacterized protein si:dkey-112e17.1 isoform X2 [Hypomesus transpacificus]|uniref:uncharacterized protein si:dkey-112e17.1 isoform X2 n=1 Tax=Hypomesus transpacificus TaxID=137520 RepID=UPI001F07B6C5|nr:uncharacterized protein si:dkey-112e17.1 isoform X2 [Hypomesus transpacificus]